MERKNRKTMAKREYHTVTADMPKGSRLDAYHDTACYGGRIDAWGAFWAVAKRMFNLFLGRYDSAEVFEKVERCLDGSMTAEISAETLDGETDTCKIAWSRHETEE